MTTATRPVVHFVSDALPGLPVSERDEQIERAKWEGAVEARLASHEQRFQTLFVSVERFASEMSGLSKAVQRLGDQAVASAATEIAKAQALKEERENAASALRDLKTKSDIRYSPAQRLFAGTAAFAGLLVAALTIYFHGRP